jgi:hypothetical protein
MNFAYFSELDALNDVARGILMKKMAEADEKITKINEDRIKNEKRLLTKIQKYEALTPSSKPLFNSHF